MATLKKRGKRWTAEVRKRDPKTGQQVRTSVTRDSKTDATQEAKAIEVSIEKGTWTGSGDSEKTTLGLLIQTMLDKGKARDEKRARWWLEHPLSKRKASSLSVKDFAEFRDARLADGRAPSTIKKDLSVVSMALRLARSDWGYEDLSNPVSAIKMPSLPEGRDRRLRVGEEERLVAAMDELGLPELKQAFVLATETAMRAGELMALRWDFLTDNGFIKLPSKVTKTKRGRLIPLSTAAEAAVKALPRYTGAIRIFHEWTYDSLDARWRRVRKKAGITDLRWHDLRHEATSKLFEKGLQIHEVRAITGHATLQMLMRYTHLDVRELKARLG